MKTRKTHTLDVKICSLEIDLGLYECNHEYSYFLCSSLVVWYSSVFCKFETDSCLTDILNIQLRLLVFDVMPFTV